MFAGAWMANLALWIGVAWWIAASGTSIRTIDAASRQALRLTTGNGEPSFSDPGWVVLWVPVAVLATGLLMFISVLLGPRPFRTIRYWLLLVAAFAAWASLGTARQDLHWVGQQHRLAGKLPAASPLVDQLRQDWPVDESGTDVLGPYLAYPKPNPTTLLLATNAPLEGTDLSISAVERSPAGAICMELAGDESPAWLEWRPSDDEPHSFTSGLETRYEVGQFARLAPHWYLVRYGIVR